MGNIQSSHNLLKVALCCHPLPILNILKTKQPPDFHLKAVVRYRRGGRTIIRPLKSIIFSMLYRKQTGTGTE